MENQHNERLTTLDIARGLSVLGMIMVHTLWMYGNTLTQAESWLGSFLHFIGKGTASFLVAMGVSLVLSRRQSQKQLALRGLQILLLAYALNALKFIIPVLTGWMPDSFIAAYGWQRPLSLGQLTYLLSTGDILQMAGVALVVLAIIKPLLKHQYQIIGWALIVALASRWGAPELGQSPWLNYGINLFWSRDYQIYFPLFPWFACILAGMSVGVYYQQHQMNPDTLFTHAAYVGVGLVILGGGLMLMDYSFHFANFFHIGPGGIAYLIGLNLVGLGVLHKIVSQPWTHLFRPFLAYCSRHVTRIYIIQWTLICWGIGIAGFQTLSTLQVLLAIPIVIALTFLVNHLTLILPHKLTKSWNNPTPKVNQV